MQKITKRGWIEIAAVSGLFVALALIAAFLDLQINKALYNPGSLFGQFFANLGELPSFLAAPFVGTVFFWQTFGKTKAQRVLWKVASAGVVFVGFFFAVGFWFWKHFIQEDLAFSIVYKLFFSALLSAGVILGTAKVDKGLMKKLLIFAIFVMVVAALSNIIVQLMKMLWARQRFRTMVDIEKNAALLAEYGKDFKGFTPWYRPNVLFHYDIHTDAYVAAHKALDSDAFKSFPSGHTVAAAASFSLILLPEMFERLKKFRWMFWVFPAIYTALVAISRIVMGAHYLSDVLFGAYIALGVAALTRFVMLRKFPKFFLTAETVDGITVLDEVA